jgi:pyruvate dehydrogenase E1 component
MRELMTRNQDCFYYLTLMNEPYAQISLPPGAEEAIVRGLHRVRAAEGLPSIRLVGSGSTVPELLEAARMLSSEWSVAAEVWSATSYAELAREARSVDRWNRLHPLTEQRKSHLEICLAGPMPIIAVSDYVRAYPGLIASYLEAPTVLLGTDGFGRSDTRRKLRRFFEIDHAHIAASALALLARLGTIDCSMPAKALERYGLSPDESDPWLL